MIEELFTHTRAVIDVRSPSEYFVGHIPHAINIPLFNDEERAAVGTSYAKLGQDQAYLLGLSIAGPRLADLVSTARAQEKPLLLYCWRGGQRSASLAWLFQSAGLDVKVIPRGYKGFRTWAHTIIAQPWDIKVIGGRTGTGKTRYLRELAEQGEQVLDLEGLAHHKGSTFGGIGEPTQPTNEHFLNLVATKLQGYQIDRTVWVEDESRSIGSVSIPTALFESMQRAPITLIEVPRTQRVSNLVEDYGNAPIEDLIEAFERIRRKLGGERCNKAIEAVKLGNMAVAAELALEYYDQTYDYWLTKRP